MQLHLVKFCILMFSLIQQDPVVGHNEIIDPGYIYTSFQPELIKCQALRPPFIPKSLRDLQNIVWQALEQNFVVKPLGSCHSGTDIICTSGVPINMTQINHFKYDSTTNHVTLGAGMKIADALESLNNLKRTLYGIATAGDITIGGAFGCGSHGTIGKDFNPGSIADHIQSLILVDGLSNVRNISNQEDLRAFKANLGLLGIIYQVTLSTVPQFKMEINHIPVSDDILFASNQIMKYLHSSDRFQFWWFPTAKQVVLSVGTRVPISTEGECETHFLTETSRDFSEGTATALEIMQQGQDHLGYFIFQGASKLSLNYKVPGRSPIFSQPNNTKFPCSTQPPVGFSHKMFQNKCKVCPWHHGNASLRTMELGVAVPLEELNEALKTMKDIFTEYPMEFPFNGIFVRFLPKSDGLMLLNGGRDSAVIEWVLIPRSNRYQDPMLGLAGSQAITQALIENHRARPHWSKNGLYYTSYDVIRKAFPNHLEFIRRMNEFDPHGVFLNDFGRRLKYGSERTSIDNYVESCGLVDNCICNNNEDCGVPGRQGALGCGKMKGYRVCRENTENDRSDYKLFRSKAVREFLKKLKNYDDAK